MSYRKRIQKIEGLPLLSQVRILNHVSPRHLLLLPEYSSSLHHLALCEENCRYLDLKESSAFETKQQHKRFLCKSRRKNLEELYLGHHVVSTEKMFTRLFQSCLNIRVLDVQGCSLSPVAVRNIGARLPHLTELFWSLDKFTFNVELGPDTLRDMLSLKTFHGEFPLMYFDKFSTYLDFILQGCPNIEEINLKFSRITYNMVEEFNKVPEIKDYKLNSFQALRISGCDTSHHCFRIEKDKALIQKLILRKPPQVPWRVFVVSGLNCFYLRRSSYTGYLRAQNKWKAFSSSTTTHLTISECNKVESMANFPTGLVELDLQNVQLDQKDFDKITKNASNSLRKFVCSQYLFDRYNERVIFKSSCLSFIRKFRNLTELDLRLTHFNGKMNVFEHISKLVKLKKLALSGCAFKVPHSEVEEGTGANPNASYPLDLVTTNCTQLEDLFIHGDPDHLENPQARSCCALNENHFKPLSKLKRLKSFKLSVAFHIRSIDFLIDLLKNCNLSFLFFTMVYGGSRTECTKSLATALKHGKSLRSLSFYHTLDYESEEFRDSLKGCSNLRSVCFGIVQKEDSFVSFLSGLNIRHTHLHSELLFPGVTPSDFFIPKFCCYNYEFNQF